MCIQIERPKRNITGYTKTKAISIPPKNQNGEIVFETNAPIKNGSSVRITIG